MDPGTQNITGQQLRDIFRPFYVDQQTRSVTTTQPEVVNLGSRPRDLGLLSFLENTDPGITSIREAFSGIAETPTVSLFLARRGSGKLEQVKRAVTDQVGARQLQEQFLSEYGNRREKPMVDAVRELVDSPVYAEFRYADLGLAEHLFLPKDLDLMTFVFPYDGGRLSPEGFSLIQWSKPGTSSELDAMIVQNAPPKTDAEQAATGAQQRPGKVSPDAWCQKTTVTVAMATAMLTAGAAAAAGPAPEAFDVADLGDDVRERLAGKPTVSELVDIRISALSRD